MRTGLLLKHKTEIVFKPVIKVLFDEQNAYLTSKYIEMNIKT